MAESQESGVFIPNPEGIAALAMSPGMTAALMDYGEELKAVIVSHTPERTDTPTGDSAEPDAFKKSIRVVPILPSVTGLRSSVNLLGGEAGLLANGGVRVESTDGRFGWIEFGTSDRQNQSGADRGEMPAYAPFRQSADSTGSYVPNIAVSDAE